MRPTGVAALLAAAFGLAFVVRALGFEWVFVDPETVLLAPGDAQYHFRRALYGWANFPSVIFFDPYINFPGGAAVSWPPLFDFLISAFGRVFAGDENSFAVIAAWAPPVFGALAVLPVYGVASRLGGPWQGLGAAFLMALLPTSVNYSRVGQLDHHCLVALIGACALLVVTRIADGTISPRTAAVAVALCRIAMLLTWHGSLLYLALLEATLWLTAATTGRRDVLGVQAVSAAATVAVVGPLVWIFPEPLGGPWSAIGLSRLHVLSVMAVAVVSAGAWVLEARGATRSASARLLAIALLGIGFVAVLFVLPATREGLEPALRFLAMEDGVGEKTREQLPLFPGLGRPTGRPVWSVWGALGFALPLLPFLVVWAALRVVPHERRRGALVVAGWCGWFGALAIVQRRYGNDLGPAAAVGFALVIGALAHRTLADARKARVVAVLATMLLLAPPVVAEWFPRARSGLVALVGGAPARDPALRTAAGSLTRFLEQVREVTPDTSGYFDLSLEPEYGIVSQANFGHAIQNVARRPTPTDPFWAFIGRANWDAAFGLLSAVDEEAAFAFAQQLQARYVMTFSSADSDTVEGWLHFADGGAAQSWPASSHFRLLTEGPRGGAHFSQSFQVKRQGRVTGSAIAPYKLFEVVEGAVLRVAAAPGEEVIATLRLGTPLGRKLGYEQRATADANGVARLRVPYPTLPSSERVASAVRAVGPYQVRAGERRRTAVAVSEEQVREGVELRVEFPSTAR